jgi:CheY-like chemotaxis protein
MAALRSRELCVAYKDCFLTTSQLPADPQLKRNILLAEDNPVNRLLAQKLLQKQGHTVTSVNNGREALELWEQNQSHQFDMILMDVQMPEMDGLQATARIREKEMGSGAHIPIIAVTAHAMKGDRERCLAAGMDAYITKPINPLDLVATIRAAWPAEAELPSIPENLIEQGPSSAELLARFDGDNELFKELAGIFLQECPGLLGGIREAMRAGDAKLLERMAHTLKGSVGNFAMQGPRETAQQLELLAKSGQLSGAEEIFHTLEQEIADFNHILEKNIAEPAPQPR